MWLMDLVFTLPVLIGFLVFGLFCEHNDARGWTIFALIVAGIVGLNLYHLPLILLAYAAIPYIIVGVIWSFWRYKRHVSAKVAEYQEKGNIDGYTDLDNIKARLHPNKMLGTIVAWIIVWPLSFIDSFLGDIINVLESLVTTVFKRVYYSIYDKAVAAFDVALEDKKTFVKK
jgi:hypothetical protein